MTKNNVGVLPVRLLGSDEDYKKLGLSRQHVEKWEDGLRSHPELREYEWWYFDTELEDGSKLVITFFTKPYVNFTAGLFPLVDFNLTRPNGENVVRLGMKFEPSEFSASKEHCDVRIGKNYFTGELHDYKIHVEFEDFVCDVSLTNALVSWRPQTGIRYYGDKQFNWVVAVPNGKTVVNINNAGKKETLNGIGYHDHNWGDEELSKLIHHWYWGRGKVGDYFFVFAYVCAESEYGYVKLNDLLLARDGKIIADRGDLLTFDESEPQTDQETGKPFANVLQFAYEEENKKYSVVLENKEIIVRTRFHDAKDGAYLRFAGNAAFKSFEDGKLVDENSETAIWEMMYFGLPMKV